MRLSGSEHVLDILSADDMPVDHVEDFKLLPVQLFGRRRAAVFYHQDIEAFVRKAAHG